jgi:hypothetical protein
MRKKEPSRTYDGKFVGHTEDLLTWRAMSLSAHRVLARIEIELCTHWQNNGELIVTHKDFLQYGIHDHAVAPGIRELEALRLIRVTQRGQAGNADQRRPTKFELTYRPTKGGPPSDAWRTIKDMRQAKALAKAAREDMPKGYPRRPRNVNKSPLVENAKTTGGFRQ